MIFQSSPLEEAHVVAVSPICDVVDMDSSKEMESPFQNEQSKKYNLRKYGKVAGLVLGVVGISTAIMAGTGVFDVEPSFEQPTTPLLLDTAANFAYVSQGSCADLNGNFGTIREKVFVVSTEESIEAVETIEETTEVVESTEETTEVVESTEEPTEVESTEEPTEVESTEEITTDNVFTLEECSELCVGTEVGLCSGFQFEHASGLCRTFEYEILEQLEVDQEGTSCYQLKSFYDNLYSLDAPTEEELDTAMVEEFPDYMETKGKNNKRPTPRPTKRNKKDKTPRPTRRNERPTPRPTRRNERPTPRPTRRNERPTPRPTFRNERPTPRPTRRNERPTPRPTRRNERPTPRPTRRPNNGGGNSRCQKEGKGWCTNDRNIIRGWEKCNPERDYCYWEEQRCEKACAKDNRCNGYNAGKDGYCSLIMNRSINGSKRDWESNNQIIRCFTCDY